MNIHKKCFTMFSRFPVKRPKKLPNQLQSGPKDLPSRPQERPRRASRATHPKIAANPPWPPRFWSLRGLIWELWGSNLGSPGASLSSLFEVSQ